jgi:neurotransmitter:Na+ symporter, NSS family
MLSLLVGIPSALSYGLLSDWQLVGRPLLDAADYLGSNFLLPVAGLLVAMTIGWRLRRRDAIREAGLAGLVGQLWLWSIKVVVPVAIILILWRAMVAL